MKLKSLLEFLPRHLIEFVDGQLRVLDRLHQVVAFPPQKLLALFAFLEFLERHHIHRPHGFHARFHFVVIRFGGDQILADQQLRFLRHQFFRLRIQFRSRRFGADIRDPHRCAPFRSAAGCVRREAHRAIGVCPRSTSSIWPVRDRASLPIRFRAPPCVLPAASFRCGDLPACCASSAQARFDARLSQRPESRAAGEAHSARSFACAISSASRCLRLPSALARRSATVASSSRRATTRSCNSWKSRRKCASLSAASADSASASARERSASACLARACSARARAASASPRSRAISSRSVRKLLLHAEEFAPRLVALMRCRDQRFFRFHCCAVAAATRISASPRDFFFKPRQVRLLLLGHALQPVRFRLRAGEARASAPAVRHRSCVPRKPCGRGSRCHPASENNCADFRCANRSATAADLNEVSSLKFCQKVFRCRPERLAEIHQPIQPRDEYLRGIDAPFSILTGCPGSARESTKNVARPPISSRSKATPVRA